jgi:3,4-dihydroxy 2-butanone 4-phosphate synthase
LSSYHFIITLARLVRSMIAAARPTVALPSELAHAGDSLSHGEPVLIYDAPDREGETDLVILAERATPELIRLLRKDAGGLLCVAVSDDLRRRIGLPFQAEMLELAEGRFPALAALRRQDLRYDTRSAFGVTVNHRSNFTGVPDTDRATTVRALGDLAREAPHLTDVELADRFTAGFTSPGHVPILYAAPGLVDERKGHTELAICLTRMAGLSEAAVVCEMLGDSGGPRSPEAARRYAEAHGWVFLEGRAIHRAWPAWSG